MTDVPEPHAPPAQSLSALAPLKTPAFRLLWTAGLLSNTCLWLNDVAAAWLMTTLTTSPVIVALVSSAATLPMFLLGLPSGAVADIVDRKRYLLVTQAWVGSVAILTALAVGSGVINATLLLVLTFANGAGLAMRLPVMAAIVPTLVDKAQLPAALALNGVAMNASRIIGPTLAGVIIASAGSTYVYILNAVLATIVGVLVLRWKHEPQTTSALPGERFLGAMRVGVQYVRQSQRMRVVLLRVMLFFVQSSALMALLPLLARRMHGPSAGAFSMLLAAMGAGAITAALSMPRLRQRYTPDQMMRRGSLIHAAASITVAFAPNLWVAVPAMFFAGTAWLAVANSLSISAQMALPDWVRARGMSIFQMSLMGSSAIGSALWGQVAGFSGVQAGVTIGSCAGVVAMLLLRHVKLSDASLDDLTPQRTWTPPVSAVPVDPDAGPVLVTIEYFVDPGRVDDFKAVMQDSRRTRLQHGALAWELFRDSADPRRWIEYFIDESWVEHLRRFDRTTAGDVALRERRLAFHVGDRPPVVSRFVAEPMRRPS